MTVKNLQVELNKQSISHLREGLTRIEDIVIDIKKENKEMFNHFTEKYEKIFKELKERLPRWAVWALTILAAIIGALAQGILS